MKYLPCLMALSVMMSTPVFAQSKDPTPRTGMSPLDRAKVKRAEAGMRRGLGIEQSPRDTAVSGRPGEQSCTTNVGTTYVQSNPGQRSGSSRGDTVVVVRGDVINLCR